MKLPVDVHVVHIDRYLCVPQIEHAVVVEVIVHVHESVFPDDVVMADLEAALIVPLRPEHLVGVTVQVGGDFIAARRATSAVAVRVCEHDGVGVVGVAETQIYVASRVNILIEYKICSFATKDGKYQGGLSDDSYIEIGQFMPSITVDCDTGPTIFRMKQMVNVVMIHHIMDSVIYMNIPDTYANEVN